jgi:hypothetical protein
MQEKPMAIMKDKPMVALSLFIKRLFLGFFDRKNLIDLNILKYL